MPVEFSVAAYRFGHSMVRPSYLINEVARTDPPVAEASRIPLFSQTGDPKQSLSGFQALRADWGVQWKYLLPRIEGADSSGADRLPSPATSSTPSSHTRSAHCPAAPRARRHSSPDRPRDRPEPGRAQPAAGAAPRAARGQDVARAMGIEPLTDDELLRRPDA